MRMQGKVAIVTGAASGIGRAIAERYVQEGARVCIADIRGAAETAKAIGPAALGVQMDVTDEKQVEEGVAACAQHFGSVDVLVSNAGVQHIAALTELKLSDWKRMLACKTVAKEGAAHHIRANVICPGFVRTPLVEKQIPEQARDLGISEEEVIKNVMLKNTVDGEFTTLEDVAEVAVFFAAFPSNALTGQSVVVSHGWHMQ